MIEGCRSLVFREAGSLTQTQKQPTRDRLLDAAERLFAQRGFAGASVRDIVASARANVSSIKYYFGSKENLFKEVLNRRLVPINLRRLALLEEAQQEGDPLDVARIVACLIEPVFECVAKDQNAILWLGLTVRSRIEAGDLWRERTDLSRKTFRIFVKAFQRALPHLSQAEIAQRAYFATGTATHALADASDVHMLGCGLKSWWRNPHRSSRRLVAMLTAAMSAGSP